jgi:hypothetical protein
VAEDQELIRLAGTVLEVSDPAPGSWTMTVDGTPEQAMTPGTFVVEVEDRPIKVTVGGATSFHGTPSRTGKGGWRELAPTLPLAPSSTIAPFAPVTFSAIVPEVGARIAIYGTVTAREIGMADYREQPPSTVTAVRSKLIAIGKQAEAALTAAIHDAFPVASRPAPVRRRKPPDPTRFDPGNPRQRLPLRDWMWSAAMIAVSVLFYVVGITAGSANRWAGNTWTIGGFACAVMIRPRRKRMVFRHLADRPETRFGITQDPALAVYLFIVLALSGMPVFAPLFAWTVPGWFVAALVALAVNDLSAQRRLVGAAAWDGELDRDVRVEGIVRDPTPVTIGGTAAALGRAEQWKARSGSDPDVLVVSSFENKGTYLVDAAVGVVEVDPAETLWASTVTKVEPRVDGSNYKVVELIPIGGKIVAAGRVVAGSPPKLVASGTRAAIVLATSKHGEPLALARRMLMHHVVTIGLVAALGVIATVICVRG